MTINGHIPEKFMRVSLSIGSALSLNNSDSWLGLSLILSARLERHQRAALAFVAIKSLDREDGVLTVEAALDAGAGPPDLPLFGVMDQAAFWADSATPEELAAYCLACYDTMPRDRQAAFLEFVKGRQVA